MPWIHSLTVLLTGFAVFWTATKFAEQVATTSAAHQSVLKSVLIFFTFGLVMIWRTRVPGSYGFTGSIGVRWSVVLGSGAALGALSSVILLLLGGRGMQPVFGSMKFWQIVLIVWLGSSVSEEMFTRGWAQGAMARWREVKAGAVSLPVLTGAVLFGAMHVTLFRRVDPVTATVVIISTTVLGLLAGWFRERHGGLAPAIAAHMSFNAGGMLGGVVYVIGYRLFHGKMPLTSVLIAAAGAVIVLPEAGQLVRQVCRR